MAEDVVEIGYIVLISLITVGVNLTISQTRCLLLALC